LILFSELGFVTLFALLCFGHGSLSVLFIGDTDAPPFEPAVSEWWRDAARMTPLSTTIVYVSKKRTATGELKYAKK
jgi:hypothetical protein